eukprot:4138521-Pyramimonas_sp.AAC.1
MAEMLRDMQSLQAAVPEVAGAPPTVVGDAIQDEELARLEQEAENVALEMGLDDSSMADLERLSLIHI